MKISLVINPHSGRGRAAAVAQTVQAALEQAGHEVYAELVSRELEVEPASELVVIVGGDGTVHHVAPHAVAMGVPIYHVPMGTENLFARQFRMTRDTPRLLHAITTGRVRSIDIARARQGVPTPAVAAAGQLPTARQSRAPGAAGAAVLEPPPARSTTFLLMLSVGPDAGVVHRLAAARTGAIGHWSYIRPILHESVRPSRQPLTVDVDGRRLIDGRSGLLVVANSLEYGARINPAPRASISDGLLDIVFFPAGSAVELVFWAVRARFGRHVRSRRLVYQTGREVLVTSASGQAPYQLDGEAGHFVGEGDQALHIGIESLALRVLCPVDAPG